MVAEVVARGLMCSHACIGVDRDFFELRDQSAYSIMSGQPVATRPQFIQTLFRLEGLMSRGKTAATVAELSEILTQAQPTEDEQEFYSAVMVTTGGSLEYAPSAPPALSLWIGPPRLLTERLGTPFRITLIGGRYYVSESTGEQTQSRPHVRGDQRGGRGGARGRGERLPRGAQPPRPEKSSKYDKKQKHVPIEPLSADEATSFL